MPDGFDKFRLQVLRRNQPQKRAFRVEVAGDQRCIEFVAVLKNHAAAYDRWRTITWSTSAFVRMLAP